MSVDFSSQAIIGCRVSKSGLYKSNSRRNCKCKNINLEDRYCSKCGCFVYNTSPIPIKGYDPDNSRLCGLVCLSSTDGAVAVVGKLSASASANGDSGGSMCSLNGESIAELRDETQKVLEPLGMWNPDEFGLWSLPYVSY